MFCKPTIDSHVRGRLLDAYRYFDNLFEVYLATVAETFWEFAGFEAPATKLEHHFDRAGAVRTAATQDAPDRDEGGNNAQMVDWVIKFCQRLRS